MKLLKISLLAIVALFVSATAKAQGCQPQYNYSTSESISASSDLSIVYASGQISGSSQMSIEYCGVANHTPGILAEIADTTTGSTVGNSWVYGAEVCGNCSLSESVTNSMGTNTQDQYQINIAEEVTCSRAGRFFYSSTINHNYEEAITYSKNFGVSCGPGCTSIYPWCTTDSQNPDYNPGEVLTDNPNILISPYFNGLSYCDRPIGAAKGTPWTCLTPSPMVTPKSDPNRHVCTNWDANTKGLYP